MAFLAELLGAICAWNLRAMVFVLLVARCAQAFRGTMFCCVALLITGSGCGGRAVVWNVFEGAPPVDIATIELDRGIRLVSVDGRPVPGAGVEGSDELRERVLRLLPGMHCVLAGVRSQHVVHTKHSPPGSPAYNYGMGLGAVDRYPGSQADEVLKFTAVAGHEYRMRLERRGGWEKSDDRWRVIILDQSSGKFEDVVSKSLGKVPHAGIPMDSQSP